MHHQPDLAAGWAAAAVPPTVPAPLDCETQVLLRQFLTPILETATSWDEIAERLQAKDYAYGFAEGRLVIGNSEGKSMCTGTDLGIPLATIVARIGSPHQL